MCLPWLWTPCGWIVQASKSGWKPGIWKARVNTRHVSPHKLSVLWMDVLETQTVIASQALPCRAVPPPVLYAPDLDFCSQLQGESGVCDHQLMQTENSLAPLPVVSFNCLWLSLWERQKWKHLDLKTVRLEWKVFKLAQFPNFLWDARRSGL